MTTLHTNNTVVSLGKTYAWAEKYGIYDDVWVIGAYELQDKISIWLREYATGTVKPFGYITNKMARLGPRPLLSAADKSYLWTSLEFYNPEDALAFRLKFPCI